MVSAGLLSVLVFPAVSLGLLRDRSVAGRAPVSREPRTACTM
jgi:hypothetical protein